MVEGKAVSHNRLDTLGKSGLNSSGEFALKSGEPQQLPNQPCPQCGSSLDDLSVVCAETTDSLRSLWRDYKLSKQAKDFLTFLIEKNIDGATYSKPRNNLEPCDDFPHQTKYVGSKEVNGKWIVGVKTDFYSKGVSLIGYISANRNKLPDPGLFVNSLSGELSTNNLALRNSLNRTIHRLWHWGILRRFYFPSMYGPKHYYFITEKGGRVFHAKCCVRHKQHLEQKSTELATLVLKQTALMVRQ
jgi:hypothetical protein